MVQNCICSASSLARDGPAWVMASCSPPPQEIHETAYTKPCLFLGRFHGSCALPPDVGSLLVVGVFVATCHSCQGFQFCLVLSLWLVSDLDLILTDRCGCHGEFVDSGSIPSAIHALVMVAGHRSLSLTYRFIEECLLLLPVLWLVFAVVMGQLLGWDTGGGLPVG